MQTERKERAYAKGLSRGRRMLADSYVGRRYWLDAAHGLALLLDISDEEIATRVSCYHRERLDAVPDLSIYPELRGYRELLEEEYCGMRDAGVDELTIAYSVSLNFWRDVRLVEETGRAWHAAPQPEKCRIVYVPESDRGALHAKNVDDPLTYFTPRPPIAPGTPWPWNEPLCFDGVGSGLHIDEPPPEIFPADAREMAKELCTTVDEAREFLVRYTYFWSSQNLLVHDQKGNSVAFEKTRCRVAARGPNANGINWITGMGALDPGISAHQRAMRRRHLELTGQDENCADAAFWRLCDGTWCNMARYIDELSLNPSYDNLKQLMEQRDSSGPMCLTGTPCHPDDTAPGCTLFMDIWLLERRQLYRRQWRGTTPAFLDTPEFVQFG